VLWEIPFAYLKDWPVGADQIADHGTLGRLRLRWGFVTRHPLTALYEADQRIENLPIERTTAVLAEVIGEVSVSSQHPPRSVVVENGVREICPRFLHRTFPARRGLAHVAVGHLAAMMYQCVRVWR